MTDAMLFDEQAVEDLPAVRFRMVQVVKPEVETIDSPDPGCDHSGMEFLPGGIVYCFRCDMRLKIRLTFSLLDAVPLADPDERRLGPFARDSDTSRAAALASYPRQGTQRWQILRYLFDRQEEGRPGCTREELAIEVGMSPDAVRPRVVELRRGGWICAVASGAHDTDAEETRRTALGQDAEVLVLTVTAVEKLRALPA